MRCCALTKEKWRRCSNKTKFIFCKQHKKGWWLRIASFIFVSVPTCFFLYKQIYNEFPFTQSTLITNRFPVFDRIDTRFKILVLPFDKECDYQGKKYDIGEVICRRLELLNRDDTLNLITYHLTDSIDITNLSSRGIDSLMRYHNANQIVYGYYSFKECEANSTDKICFMYRTDSNLTMDFEDIQNPRYVMMDMEGLQSIRNGHGQEYIDHIIYRLAGTSAIYTKQFHRAIRLLQKVHDYYNYQSITMAISGAYSGLNQLEAEKKFLETVTSNNPKNSMAWNDLGVVVSKLGNKLKGKTYYDTAIQVNTKNVVAWYNLGNFYGHLKKYDQAINCYKNALVSEKPNFGVYNNLGYTYRLQKNYEQAEYFLKKALDLRPHDTTVLWNMAITYKYMKNYLRAKETFEHYLEHGQKHSLAIANLNYINWELARQ